MISQHHHELVEPVEGSLVPTAVCFRVPGPWCCTMVLSLPERRVYTRQASLDRYRDISNNTSQRRISNFEEAQLDRQSTGYCRRPKSMEGEK